MYQILSGDRYACETCKSKILNVLLNTSHLKFNEPINFSKLSRTSRFPNATLIFRNTSTKHKNNYISVGILPQQIPEKIMD